MALCAIPSGSVIPTWMSSPADEMEVHMFNLHAVATRHHGRITVTLGAELATTCDSAEVIDWYPGGDRVYVTNPGAAQVFIAETVRPGPCGEVIMPWNRTVDIFDEADKTVEIFVNEQKRLTVPVQDVKREYDVYKVLVQPENLYVIVPEGQLVPAIYVKVFGPASYQACVDYVNKQPKAA